MFLRRLIKFAHSTDPFRRFPAFTSQCECPSLALDMPHTTNGSTVRLAFAAALEGVILILLLRLLIKAIWIRGQTFRAMLNC